MTFLLWIGGAVLGIIVLFVVARWIRGGGGEDFYDLWK